MPGMVAGHWGGDGGDGEHGKLLDTGLERVVGEGCGDRGQSGSRQGAAGRKDRPDGQPPSGGTAAGRGHSRQFHPHQADRATSGSDTTTKEVIETCPKSQRSLDGLPASPDLPRNKRVGSVRVGRIQAAIVLNTSRVGSHTLPQSEGFRQPIRSARAAPRWVRTDRLSARVALDSAGEACRFSASLNSIRSVKSFSHIPTLPIVCLLFSCSVAAERFNLEHAARVVNVLDPQISHDGKSIVVAVARANLKDNRYDTELVLVDIGTKKRRF